MTESVWRDPVIRRMSFGAQLSRNAQRRPRDVVYTHGDRTVTWEQLDDGVDRLAAGLQVAGVASGDRIAVLMYNSIDVAEIYLAIARVGAICVPVNFRLVADEVAYILSDSRPRLVFTDAANGSTAIEAVERAECDAVVIGCGRNSISRGVVSLEAFVAVAAPSAPVGDIAEDEAAFIMYTSGTTGRPKGAVLTYLNLISSALAVGLATGGRPSQPDVRLLSVPMFHIAGLSNVLGPLLDGGRVVIQHTTDFDPVATLDLLENEQITNCFMVPTQWQAVCAVPGARDRRLALRLPYWGASVAPPAVLQALADTFPGAPAYSAFGMTETSSIATLLSGVDALRKQGSVGKPIPLIQARIVDDNMNDVAVGEVGEIVYRGPMVMREYWGDPAATAEAFSGGWFHSGDMCRMDDEGFIWVVDRKKDLIISGGENISSAEVEAAVLSHPGVADVAVVGVAHPRWVQTPCAVIVARDPADPPSQSDIIEHCRSRLASYKKPSRVVITERLPRNAGGKVLKAQIRADLEGPGAQSAATGRRSADG